MTNLIEQAADPNAPKAASGNRSDLQHRFDLVDGPAMYEMTNILHKGALKYGENNWRDIPVEDHLNHMIAHAYAYLAGNRSDRHLANIMCRAMFAQGRALMDEDAEPNKVDLPVFTILRSKFCGDHSIHLAHVLSDKLGYYRCLGIQE